MGGKNGKRAGLMDDWNKKSVKRGQKMREGREREKEERKRKRK